MGDLSQLASTGLGAFLALLGGLVALRARRWWETNHWYRELHISNSTDLLVAMQGFVRQIVNIAYLPGRPLETIVGVPGSSVTEPDVFLADGSQEFYESVNAWNSALHRLVLAAPPRQVAIARSMDVELDRLLDVAVTQTWPRGRFREERSTLGDLAADFVAEVRAEARLPEIPIDNVWTWADDRMSAG